MPTQTNQSGFLQQRGQPNGSLGGDSRRNLARCVALRVLMLDTHLLLYAKAEVASTHRITIIASAIIAGIAAAMTARCIGLLAMWPLTRIGGSNPNIDVKNIKMNA